MAALPAARLSISKQMSQKSLGSLLQTMHARAARSTVSVGKPQHTALNTHTPQKPIIRWTRKTLASLSSNSHPLTLALCVITLQSDHGTPTHSQQQPSQFSNHSTVDKHDKSPYRSGPPISNRGGGGDTQPKQSKGLKTSEEPSLEPTRCVPSLRCSAAAGQHNRPQ